MPLRTRIFIAVGAVVLVILIVVAAIYFRPKKQPAVTPIVNTPTVIDSQNIETAVNAGTEPTVVPQNAVAKPTTSAQQEEITVKNTARIFVERFHTYSSENNYQNIRDVEAIVTNSFWKKISAPLSLKQTAPSFVSVTTEVVSVSSVDVNRDTATVEIKTKKTSVANGKTSEGYGDYSISLIKANGEWFVSGEAVK